MKQARHLFFAVVLVLFVAACNKPVEDNPTYNDQTNEVTAEFVLSVSTQHGPATKMTEADVQYDGSFRGMDEVHLLTYNLDYKQSNTSGTWLYKSADSGNSWAESSQATRDYDLGTVMTAGEISASQSSKVLQISLPLQTNTVLLYGRAPLTKTKNDQGSVIATGNPLNATVENISFKLENRLTSLQAFRQFTDMMSRMLTGILCAGRTNETVASGMYRADRDNTYAFWWPINEDSSQFATVDANNTPIPNGTTQLVGGTTYTMYRGSKTWRDYGVDYAKNIDADPSNDVNLKPCEEIMGESYYKITTLNETGSGDTKATELRAASSAAILRLMEDSYKMMTRVSAGSITSPEDYIAKLVADEIIFRSGRFFTGTTTDLAWRELTSFKSNINYNIPDRDWDTDYYLIDDKFFYSLANNHPGFPMNLGLPSGAALMHFRNWLAGDGQVYDIVEYYENIPSYGMGSASSTLSINNYRYPAELMYWTNSSLRVSDNVVLAANYPKTVETWDVDNWQGWDKNGAVKSTTRSVAITKEVNYGTALLKSTFKYGAATLYDNNQGMHPAEDPNTIDATAANQFKVTGIIIGGVCDDVNWCFLPRDNTFSKVIYDQYSALRQINMPAYGSTSDPTFTLTWDNYNSSLGDLQSKVYICVEMVNNTGQDLWGELNVIRAGGTFYLVGMLDPTVESARALLPKTNGEIDLSRKNFNYPPYDANGNTISIPRVFMQDYVTEVNFTFGPNSLKHAYVTMPDLRASNVSLGLSVDLNWAKGLKFDDVVLGGN